MSDWADRKRLSNGQRIVFCCLHSDWPRRPGLQTVSAYKPQAAVVWGCEATFGLLTWAGRAYLCALCQSVQCASRDILRGETLCYFNNMIV